MSYPRPVPTIGDPTSAAERAADTQAWRMPSHISALDDVIGARRDIRRYRPDSVDEEILLSVLRAGHHAPSVGQSQPWRFIVIEDQGTRDRAAAMADASRIRQAAAMSEQSARGLLDLQLDGIREAPLGIVVACDRRTPAAGVLGRATFPDADLWSCAAAIENMWLTARAHGLGMGWVTLFEPEELHDLVGLPDGVESLGWLCLGWPDERPPEPGLQRAGWSRRLPLESVVMRERFSGAEPPTTHLRGPEPARVVAARDAADRLLSPPGALGLLDGVLDRIGALTSGVDAGTLLIAAADHAVTEHGVSAFSPSVTRDVYDATVAGVSYGASAARNAGLVVQAIDAGIGVHHGDLVRSDALNATTCDGLIQDGISAGRAAAATGLVALGEIGIGNTTVAATLSAALLGLSAEEVIGRGAGADSAMLDRKRDVVRRAIARVGPDSAPDLLRRLGGGEFAVLTGVVLGAARAGAPIVLDGLATSVAALIAVRIEPGVSAHLIAGQRSRELAHPAVLAAIGLEPILDLRLRCGEGVGAALACGLILDGLKIRAHAARTHDRNQEPAR